MDFETTLDNNMGAGLELNSESKNYLRETSKWAKFLSIVYFVLIGLMGVMMLFAGSMMATFIPASEFGGAGGAAMTAGMIVYFLLIGALVFFPAFYMYKFSTGIKKGLESESTADLTEGLKNMKSYWKFIGILTLVFVVLYGIIFVIMLITGGMAAAFG